MKWTDILKAKRVGVGDIEPDKYYSFDEFELNAEFTENSSWPNGFSRITTKGKYGSSTKYPSDEEMRTRYKTQRSLGRGVGVREGEKESYGQQEFSLMFETKGRVVVYENDIEVETIPHDKIDVVFNNVKFHNRDSMPMPIEFKAEVDIDDLPVIYVEMIVG
jgi:hypothetical protein